MQRSKEEKVSGHLLPLLLKEYVKDYFELDEPVPFMEKVFQLKRKCNRQFRLFHTYDGSGRLQTVDRTVSQDIMD